MLKRLKEELSIYAKAEQYHLFDYLVKQNRKA